MDSIHFQPRLQPEENSFYMILTQYLLRLYTDNQLHQLSFEEVDENIDVKDVF